MELDNNWPIPEGFEAVKNYRDGNVTVVGLLRLPAEPGKRQSIESRDDLTFRVGVNPKGAPTLPLRERGEFHHEGWDIPTRWAIDGNGICWMDDAHGHALGRVSPRVLLAECSNEAEKRRLQGVLGLPIDRPSWVLTALRYGWTPPEGWKDP